MNYLNYEIKDKKTGKKLTVEEFALERYKKGEHIIYCDIECLAHNGENFFVLDECGNYVVVNPDEYEVNVKNE